MGPDGNYPFNNILGADSLLRHFSVHVFLVLFLKMFLLCNLEWPWTLYLPASDSSCWLPCSGVNHLLITIRMRCQPHHMNFSWQSWLRLLHCQHSWELCAVQNYKPCIHGQDVFSWNLWPKKLWPKNQTYDQKNLKPMTRKLFLFQREMHELWEPGHVDLPQSGSQVVWRHTLAIHHSGD